MTETNRAPERSASARVLSPVAIGSLMPQGTLPARGGMDRFEIRAAGMRAAVLRHGAELCSLRDATGREFLWQAGPIWPRHAPNLFPIVGRLRHDTLRHDGREYRLTQHGFARDRDFAWTAREADHCRLELADDAGTRALYPFAFRLAVDYRVGEAGLEIAYTVSNPGPGNLPASVGAHPAFAWPLLPGVAKSAHRIELAQEEAASIPRLRDGLLLAERVPSPVRGRSLALDEHVFDADALIFQGLASRSLRYTAPGAPAIEVAWEGFPDLGIWSRRPGDFLCIEPWHGTASPADFDGDFTGKPGLMHLAPGESRALALRIALRG